MDWLDWIDPASDYAVGDDRWEDAFDQMRREAGTMLDQVEVMSP